MKGNCLTARTAAMGIAAFMKTAQKEEKAKVLLQSFKQSKGRL